MATCPLCRFLNKSANDLKKQNKKTNLEFGSYSISSRHQDGVHKACCLQVKQASKTSQFSITAWWEVGEQTPIWFRVQYSDRSNLIFHLCVTCTHKDEITRTRRGLGQWFDGLH